VARVRNLGHPRRVVVAVQADGVLSSGDPVLCGDDDAGTITSAAVFDRTAYAMIRVGWQWRAGPFRALDGEPLIVRT
jgi:folate-binding Fe-S cluster repair protein YgfZ